MLFRLYRVFRYIVVNIKSKICMQIVLCYTCVEVVKYCLCCSLCCSVCRIVWKLYAVCVRIVWKYVYSVFCSLCLCWGYVLHICVLYSCAYICLQVCMFAGVYLVSMYVRMYVYEVFGWGCSQLNPIPPYMVTYAGIW